MNLLRRQIYLFFVTILVLSCQNDTSRGIPDVSHVASNIRIERFDQDLEHLDSANAREWNAEMADAYGQFYTDYLLFMLEAGNPQDTAAMASVLRAIAVKPDFIDLAKAVSEKYPDLQSVEEELNQAYRFLHYYLDEVNQPRFISFFSGFAYQVPVGEDYIGIGLDMFLGSDSKFYPALIKSIPLYISRRFTPENIVPRVIEGVLREEILPASGDETNTLTHMIYQGKILYAMDLVLPHAPDSLKIGYTEAQMTWANQYRADIWAWFVGENLLYSTDYNRIQKYFTEAPFTPELGEQQESAPKLGSYIGWHIVRQYMERHPDVTLQALFEETDAQAILDKSKFKGK